MTGEDGIVAKLNARDRATWRLVTYFAALILLLVAMFCLGFLTGHSDWLLSLPFQIGVAVIFGLSFIVVFLRFARQFGPSVDQYDPQVVRKRIDTAHRTWRWLLANNIVVATVCIWNRSRALTAFSAADRPYLLLFAAMIVFVVVLFTANTLAGPGGFDPKMHALLNDEFVRDLKSRTARFGYCTLLAGASAGLFVAIGWPEFTLPALAWVLYAGFAVPTLYYIVADWRASREK